MPGEDRYAALKDLDSLMKSQQQQQKAPEPVKEWNPGKIIKQYIFGLLFTFTDVTISPSLAYQSIYQTFETDKIQSMS